MQERHHPGVIESSSLTSVRGTKEIILAYIPLTVRQQEECHTVKVKKITHSFNSKGVFLYQNIIEKKSSGLTKHCIILFHVFNKN